MEGIKGERSEQQSDRVENHHQNVFDLGCFEVQKVRFFIQNALGRSSKLCFLCGRGAHFQKSRERNWSEIANFSRGILDGKCDAYDGAWWVPKTEMLKKYRFLTDFLTRVRPLSGHSRFGSIQ